MKPISRGKKLLFSAITVILMMGAVEVGLHVLYGIVERQIFPFGRYQETIRSIAASEDGGTGQWEEGDSPGGGGRVVEVIHPYLGFVRDPNRTPNTSNLGFPEPKRKKNTGGEDAEDVVHVVVLGGSFAAGTSQKGREVLESILRQEGFAAHIRTFALGGYKQPQQLFTLAWLLSRDQPIDVVVNIDGFNEVALPPAENLPKGVSPYYPRAWQARTLGLNDHETLREIGRVSLLREDRRRWARRMESLPWFSITRNLVWQARDRGMQKRIAEANEAIRLARPQNSRGYLTTGPEPGYRDEEEMYRHFAEHWRSCSVMMDALCEAEGIEYLHFLQPNQYYEAGRELTEEERRTAFREDHAYRPGAVRGYPKLLEMESGLIEKGVNFHDLTMIFRDITEAIYKDDCCHPNDFGYELVAEAVAHSIVEALKAGSEDPPDR